MKLSTRRTVRQWFLDTPPGTATALYGAALGLTALGFLADADSVIFTGIVAAVGLLILRDRVRFDACSNCKNSVIATSERYCSTCGHRLDGLEAAPPIDDRVDERFRPVGLEHLERESARDQAPPPVADGGDRDEHEEAR
ncbi:hypothetical protein FK85_19355 [Halorubrum saccharovorum]|uniref:Uncharacterized protein n=1 Tax=Halorubrum saccharovorum TaxID=2248 RepID=A0A081EWI2_9EURY|nr:hypothetical protein [Halorubrum saccharovorum]KDS91770.1 hypothetical protein FK85_19355 [Halorubrum saccharovorum]